MAAISVSQCASDKVVQSLNSFTASIASFRFLSVNVEHQFRFFFHSLYLFFRSFSPLDTLSVTNRYESYRSLVIKMLLCLITVTQTTL